MIGNHLANVILNTVFALSSLTAASVFFYTGHIYKRPKLSNKVETEKLINAGVQLSYPDTYKLDRMVVNLRSPTNRVRFLEIQMYLVAAIPRSDIIYPQFKNQIYDAIIDIAGRMHPREVNSIHGKVLLEERIKNRINKIIGQPITQGIQFSKFIVQ